MRIVSLVGLLASTASAQIPLERLEVFQHADERADIEIVPVFVFDGELYAEIFDSTGVEGIERELENVLETQITPAMSEMMVSVRQAMHTLGVYPSQYNLIFSDHLHFMVCTQASLYESQDCWHGDLGEITDLPNFVSDLYDREAPPVGTVQFHVVVLLGDIAWKGTLGLAWHYWWTPSRTDWHWTNRACRAWALHSVPVIAHELGHCFGLDHNEENSDTGLDLMLSYYTHFNWVKDSNKEIVQQHFRYPTPETATLGVQPTVELVY